MQYLVLLGFLTFSLVTANCPCRFRDSDEDDRECPCPTDYPRRHMGYWGGRYHGLGNYGAIDRRVHSGMDQDMDFKMRRDLEYGGDRGLGYGRRRFMDYPRRDLDRSDDAAVVRRRIFLFLITRKPEDFFVGKFISDPKQNSQLNMYKVYQAFGLTPELVDRIETIELIKLNKTTAGENDTYHVREVIASPNGDQVLKDYDFQLGVRNTTKMLDRNLDHLIDVDDDKLIFHYDWAGFGPFNVTLKFNNGGSGFDAIYELPNNITGIREFDIKKDVNASSDELTNII